MKIVNVHQLNLPENFREEFFQKIFRVIKSADSGMIVGPAGMGKTLTLELLENNTILTHYSPNTPIVCTRLNLQSITPDEITKAIKDLDLPLTTKLLIIADNAEALEGPNGKDLIQRIKDIREQFRPQTSILFAAERNILGSDSFVENSSLRSVLLENILYVPPLNHQESKAFASGIGEQLNYAIPKHVLNLITETSGGAPRIIKRLVKLAYTNEGYAQEVIKNPSLDQKLCFDLESLAVFTHNHADYSFNCPLLSILKPKSATKDKIGPIQFSSTLTKQEFSLAKILIENQGNLVDREAMIKAIWPNNLYETSEHALDQMIHRLKKKLELASPTCSLVTYRGRGAKLSI